MEDLKVGDEVIVTCGDHYAFTKSGSLGIILDVFEYSYGIKFSKMTGEGKPSKDIYSLEKSHIALYRGKAPKENTSTCWSFKSNHVKDIDFSLISKELTKKNPLAFISRGDDELYVVVSKLLIEKFCQCFRGGGVDSLWLELSRITTHAYIFKTQYHQSAWVEWAKEVQSAEWFEKDPQTVEVVLPTI